MKIGIIVAMRKELDLLLPLLNDSEESRMGGFEFHCGKMGKHDVMVMQCGIGKVNAAMGSLMLVLFAIKLHILPANGSTSAGLVLPVITLMLSPMSYITRLTRELGELATNITKTEK